MAEAIAALSLAANILQMVEYGGFFVTTAWKIYSSQADTRLANDFDHLRYLTEDVENILGPLEQNDLDTASAAGLRDRDRNLLALVAESRKITKEILDSLNKIGNPAAWKARKRKAIKATFNLTWKSDHIADLQTKLDRIRSQLTLHLVHSLRYVGNNAVVVSEVISGATPLAPSYHVSATLSNEAERYHYQVVVSLPSQKRHASTFTTLAKSTELTAGNVQI